MQDLTSAVFQQLNQQPPAGGLGTGQFPEQEQLKCPRCDSTNTKFCYFNNYNLSQPRHFCKNCRRYWTKGGTLRNIPFGGGSRKNSSSSSSTGKRSSSSSTSSNNSSSSPSSFSKRGNPDLNSDTTRSTRRHVPDPAITIASTSGAATEGGAQKVLGIGSSGSAQGVTPVFGLESAVGGGGSSFSSLLRSSGQLVSVFQGLGPNGPCHLGVKMGQSGDSGGGGLVDDLNSDSVSRLGSDPSWRVEDGRGNGNNGSGGGEEGYLESGEWGNSNGWPDLAIYTPGSGFY